MRTAIDPGEVWNACVSEAGYPEMAWGFTNKAGVAASCWFFHVEPTDERCDTARRAFDLVSAVDGGVRDGIAGPDGEVVRRSWKRSWSNGRRHEGRCARGEFGA